jgi:hypothetical protein
MFPSEKANRPDRFAVTATDGTKIFQVILVKARRPLSYDGLI